MCEALHPCRLDGDAFIIVSCLFVHLLSKLFFCSRECRTSELIFTRYLWVAPPSESCRMSGLEELYVNGCVDPSRGPDWSVKSQVSVLWTLCSTTETTLAPSLKTCFCWAHICWLVNWCYVDAAAGVWQNICLLLGEKKDISSWITVHEIASLGKSLL